MLLLLLGLVRQTGLLLFVLLLKAADGSCCSTAGRLLFD
jgi:hypothetical protein